MLSKVEFHVAVTDPVQHVLRLLRKARQKDVRVLVTAPASTVQHISHQLWAAQDQEFHAHALVGQASEAVCRRSPVWLGQAASDAPSAPRMVVNLGQAAPTDLEPLERLLEVVGTDPDSATAGRQRWRQYMAAGVQPVLVFDGNAAVQEDSPLADR
jgi:DNA polymerase III subunit chi